MLLTRAVVWIGKQERTSKLSNERGEEHSNGRVRAIKVA